MVATIEALSRQLGNPVKGTHEVSNVDGITTEHYHIFATGNLSCGDGGTLKEAVDDLLCKCSYLEN